MGGWYVVRVLFLFFAWTSSRGKGGLKLCSLTVDERFDFKPTQAVGHTYREGVQNKLIVDDWVRMGREDGGGTGLVGFEALCEQPSEQGDPGRERVGGGWVSAEIVSLFFSLPGGPISSSGQSKVFLSCFRASSLYYEADQAT